MRDSMCSIIKKSVLRSCVVFPIFLCLFFVTNAFSIRTSTNTTSANWNDSGGLAWENGVVPTAANSVEVGSGFTLYIDSFTECKCESISLQSGAKIIFRPDGVNGSTLTVNGAITMNAQSQILMNTLATNNIFKLSCAGLGLSSNYDLFCASITHAGAIYNISILGDIVWNENSNADFIIDASKASTINLTCQDIQMYDDVGNDFKLYAKNSDVDITINASGYQITVPKNATFDTHIYNGNSKITLNFSYLQNTGNTYFKNDVLSSTMTVNVSGGWIKNYGTLDIWGADPATGNTNKPDLDSVRRSVTFSGTSWSYMRMLDGSNTELKNAVFTGFGYDTTDNYGILVEEVTGTTSGEAFNVYNCVAKNGYVGFYLKNCSELNHQWYDQGISSCVMYGNSFAGVVLSGTNKSEIYHCYISTNSGGNIGDGVYLNNSDMNTISRCDIYGNKIHGVVMMYSDKNLLDSNTIHDQSSSSGEEGVYLYSADKNVIIKNYCYNNPVHGIALEYDSDNNYLSQNHSFNNINGGMRVRYEANDNMFIVNYSTNNGRTGFTSHKSSETLCVQETYSGHLWGDIYLEGEINQGYKSQIWMKGCLLQSTTEFANTLEKQEFTHAESWVISQKHDNTPGLTNIWGNFALPQERHAWHTPVLKWNYTDNTYDKYAYGWNNAFDDPYSTNARRYDASGGHVLSSINTSTTTKSEVWLLTYDSSLNRWQVRGTVSGYQTNWLIPDTDYTSDQGEIRMRITHQGDGPNPCEDYVFVTVAGSTDTNVQKQVKFSDFSEQEYIGANFTNGTGSTMEIAGTSSYPTVITRKLSEDNADNSFYYGLALGGTINKIQFTTFTYVNNNGLRLNSAPLINTATIWITALEPGTTATYIAANGITHTFDNVYIDTTSVTGGVNVRATNSTLYFRDYTRPFLQDVASNSTVTWDPTLVFSGQTGFTADGVEADTINTLGSVELQVKYTDLNNNPPTTVQVWIDLDDNLTFATTEQFGMALKSGVGNDGIYSNGEIYNKIVSNIAYPSLGTSGGKVKYRFFASNPNSVTYSTYTYTLTSVYNNVISTNEATGVATSTKAFTVNGTAPRITITSPSTEQSGLVTISYKLIDDDNKPAPYNYCSITVEYRDGTTWTPATRFIGSELTTSLEASVSPGTAHTFIWDSSTDLPSRNTSTIIRITPTDEDATGTAAATASFWVDNIVATKLAFTSDEQNLEAGTTSQIVYVEAQDSGSNKDTDFNGVINLNTTSSNYTLVNSTANVVLPQILMTTGRAEFKYCDNSPGSPTITVSSTGYSSASQSWTISNPVSNTNSIVSVDGGSSFVAGSTVSIVVTVKDTNSNPVQGKTVALSATGSINSLTQPIDTSNAEGKVYASLYSTKAEDKTITALISDTNLVLVSSATITYSPGTVSTSSSTVQISTSVAATGSTVTVTATLYDAYLNVVPNKTFSVTVSPLRATDIVTSTQTTNNSGVAYAYVYSLTAEDKNVSITVNPPTGYVTLNQTKTIAFRSLDLNVPSVTSVSPENNSTLASAFSNMILVVNDTGGSGVNLSSCTFKFFYMGPYFEQYSGTAWSNYWSSITISGVTSYSPQSGGNTVTFTYAFTEQTVNGTYRIECTPYDNSNNVGSMFTADVLLNIRTEASIIRTVTGSSSGQWNNASTWDPPQVPSSNENVEVGDNFTLIIDTVSTCSAKGMTLKSGAVVMFSTITSNTAALSLSEDITMETNSRFYIVTSTLIANDFNVSVRDILLADDSAGVTINLLGNNSDISVSARDIVFTDNKGCAFSVLGSTNGTVNVTTRNITVGSNNGYNVMVSSGMNVNISATGTGAYGKVSLANGAELYSRIYGENSAVTLNIENLDVADGGDTHFQNDVLTSSMVVVVDRMKCNNGGRMYFIGTNPSGSAVKPDASTIRRNIKLMANQSTGGYVFVQGDRAGIELFNTEVYGMGRLPRSDDTETSSEMYGVTIKDDADYFVYNSNIWFGCTGIKLDTIAMQGATRVGWYNLPTASQFTYGISSSVIHNNSSYGIWYNNVSRNEVYNCIISSTIDNGQLLRLETRTIGIGAYLESSQMNTLKNCDIYNNRVQGVFVYGCDKNLFENNYIHHQAAATGEEGLYLYNSDKNVLVNNYCYNNPVHGIALEYNSENNYLTQNHCYNNRNGGFRIRYNANNNKFITNYSTNNAYIDALNPSGAGFASHSSVDTLLVEETYSNNWLGDIYLEGESNQGYISQIWLKNCLLNSATEFTNTPQKQEFTHPDSWVISQKHEGTAGLTRIWGNFTYPQSSHLWHMPSIKWNNNNQTYSRFYHGWDTTINTYDTPGKRVDANGGSRITSITLSTSTKSEIWIVTYDATLNRWKVKGSSSGVQAVYLIPDTDYTTVGQEVGLRISHSAGTPRDGEEYVFATVADSKDGDEYGGIQKTVQLCDFSESNYAGAKFTNLPGGTVEIIGVSTGPTVITRKLAEDVPDNGFYYGLILGGTINAVKFASFTYINSNGLTLNSSPLVNSTTIWISNLQSGTTATYMTLNNVAHTFDRLLIDTNTVTAKYGVTAANSTVYFRDYVRPFLPDSVSGSSLYWDPTLEWTGLTGFVSDGVEPNFAERLTDREFQVKYFDRGLASQGVAPTTIQVWIDINDNMVYETTEQFMMQLKPSVDNDGDYSNGEVYYYIYPRMNYAGDGFIRYRFYANNPNSLSVSTYTYSINSTTNTVLGFYEASGTAVFGSTVSVKGTPPRVTIDAPSGEQTGQVTITYHLIDDDNKTVPYNYCSVNLEYSLDGNSWNTATKWGGSEKIENLEASLSPGTTHTFTWDTSVDLSNTDNSVLVRITPADSDGTGTAVVSQAFNIDNIIVSKLVITSSIQDLAFGTTSQVATVEAQNSAGIKDIDAALVLNLLSNSTNYNFVDYQANVVITTVTMSLGEARFRYNDRNIGSPLLTISENPSIGISDATQNWTINTGGVNATTSTVIADQTSAIVGTTVTVTVTLKDIFGNPISGKAVEVAVSGSSNYITQPTFTTNNNGLAIARFWSVVAETKTVTITDVTDSIALVSSATVVLTADVADAAKSTFVLTPGNVVAGSTISVVTTLKDRYNNLVSGKSIAISVNPVYAGDVVTQPPMLTNTAGQSTGTVTSAVIHNKTVTVTDTTDGITLNTSLTAAFTSIDPTPPVVLRTSPEANKTLNTIFRSVSATLWDNYSLNIASSTIRLLRPNDTEVSGVKTIVSTDTIELSFVDEGSDGKYTIVVNAYDSFNNLSISSVTFTVSFTYGSIYTTNKKMIGKWNSTDTWYGGVVPTDRNRVNVEQGFTLLIDSEAVCNALSLYMYDNAKVQFVGGNCTLNVINSLVLPEAGQLEIKTTQPGDNFKLSCADIWAWSWWDGWYHTNNRAEIRFETMAQQSTITVIAEDLNLGYYWDNNANMNVITSSANSVINISCRDFTLDRYDEASLITNAPNSYITFTATGTGDHGYIALGYYSNFNVRIASSNSKIDLNVDDIKIHLDYSTAIKETAAKFELINEVNTSTLTLHVNNSVTNAGLFTMRGVNPGGAVKPDPENAFRSTKLTGNYNVAYVNSVGWVDMQNVQITGFGQSRTPKKYGFMCYQNKGSVNVPPKAVYFYNCEVSSSADTGIYLLECERLNNTWYDQGITSCVIHSNKFAGVWLDNTTKSEVKGCDIYNNTGIPDGYGIYLTQSSENMILSNNVHHNNVRGIHLESSAKNMIEKNYVHHQFAEEGISIKNSNKNILMSNECAYNPVCGLSLETSINNYVSNNSCHDNANSGIRVRYGADKNIFLINTSSNNARTGLTSHSSVDNLCVGEVYRNNNFGDVYMEGEANQGYVSQLWLKGCLLNSVTEFANTIEKQEFTKENSWVISQKHDNIPGLTRIWGQFSMPQANHLWHTPVLRWNYATDTYSTNRAHGWNTAILNYDTPMLRYDDGGIDGGTTSGTNDITSISVSSTTKSELWILSYGYGPTSNQWLVKGTASGVQLGYLTHDTDYKSDNGEVGIRLTHRPPVQRGEQYVFATIAPSGDAFIQKEIDFCDFSDPSYVGASFENKAGAIVEMIGVSTAPTRITRKLAEDLADTNFYYGMKLGGGINQLAYIDYQYLDFNGLVISSAPSVNSTGLRITNIQPSTFTAYVTAQAVKHTFDSIVIDTTNIAGAWNLVATGGSDITFRDYTRPMLPDNIDLTSKVSWDPTLLWTTQPGFIEDGVEPNLAERLTNREFQIRYFDKGLAAKGNPPTTIQVWIDLNDNMVYETTEQYSMIPKPGMGNDLDYTNGEIYYYIRPNVDYAGDGFIRYRYFANNAFSVTVSTSGEYNYEATGVGVYESTFAVKGTPPRVTVDTPVGEQWGQVLITYHLIDDDLKPYPHNLASVTVEYSKNGTSWQPCTKWLGSEDVKDLECLLSPGTTHTFTWDSNTDLPESETSVVVRITATDEDGTGIPLISQSFSIDNIRAMRLVITSPAQTVSSGTVSKEVVVEGQSLGGIKDVDANFVIGLLSNSTDYAFYVVDSSDTKISTITMIMGEVRFRYLDRVPANPVISVFESPTTGVQGATQMWSVNKGGVSTITSSVTVMGSGTYAAGSTVTVRVTLRDVDLRAVSGKTVSISVTGINNIISQPAFPTNNDGQVSASFWSSSAQMKYVTATDVSDGLAIISSAAVNITPAVVSGEVSTFTIYPSTTNLLVGTTVTVNVILRDAYSNPASSKTVVIGVAGLQTSDSYVQPGLTDNSGLATGFVYINSLGSKVFTVTDTSDDIILRSSYTIVFRSLTDQTGDIVPPVVYNTTPQNGGTLSAALSEVYVNFTDTGGSGVNFASSTIRIFRPDGAEIIGGTKTVTGSNTLKLNFNRQVINGTYTMVITPYDNANNIGTIYTSIFNVSISLNEASNILKENTYAYPNPASNGRASLGYMVVNNAHVVIKIYDIMGKIVFDDEADVAAGTNNYPWLLTDEQGNKVAPGLYIYQVRVRENTGNEYSSGFKKVIVVQ